MGKTLIIAEKPSVAADITRALPGKFVKSKTHYEGGDYIVSFALGHLVSIGFPEDIDSALQKWSFDNLPILPDEFPLLILPETNAQYAATIAIPYRGTLGEYQAFRAHNVNSWCIDLQGDWKPWEGTVRPSGSGIAASVQVGRHKGWARISMVASDPRAVLKEEITYTADTLFIRIARTQDQNQGQTAAAPATRPQRYRR